MGAKNHYKAQQFIDAIPGTGGIISTIAAKVGCAWHTAKKYIDGYPTIQKAYQDECEKVLDLAETVIITSIKNKDEQTAKWYLTMKGHDRGYVKTNRHNLEGRIVFDRVFDGALGQAYDDGDDSTSAE